MKYFSFSFDGKQCGRQDPDSDTKLKGDFWDFLMTFFNTTSYAVSQIPLFRMMLGSNLGQLQVAHWLSDAPSTRLDLIHARLDLIHSLLDFIRSTLDFLKYFIFSIFKGIFQ